MKKSLRRIGTTLTMAGLLLLSLVTLQQVALLCGSGQNSCLVAAVSFGVPEFNVGTISPDLRYSGSTVDNAPPSSNVFPDVVEVAQVLSVYLIMIGVILLAALELVELKYLRQLTNAQGKRA
jgi:hypothetical protein